MIPPFLKLLRCVSFGAVLTGLWGLPLPALAQAPDGVDARTILGELEQIRQRREAMTRSGVANAQKQIAAALGSDRTAMDLYEDAVRATQFAGANKEGTQFREWKKKEEGSLKSANVRKAVRYHLQYMNLTLQRASGTLLESLLVPLVSHAAAVHADRRSFLGNDRGPQGAIDALMKSSVAESAFAKYWMIEDLLSKAEDWEMSPGNLDAIYAKVVFPELRKKKDPRLLQLWDARILQESERAADRDTSFASGKFQQVKLPQMQWQRAQDTLLLGDQPKAINQMFAIIKSNPMNPNTDAWITQLGGLLRKKSAVAPAESSTAADAPVEDGSSAEEPAPGE